MKGIIEFVAVLGFAGQAGSRGFLEPALVGLRRASWVARTRFPATP